MQVSQDPIILDHMAALAESARCRLLLLLEEQELTVSDLCSVLQLPQSTVSRHLKTLLDRGWVSARPDGTRRLYRVAVEELDPSARRLWELARAELEKEPGHHLDRERLRSVLARRRSRSQEFFDASSDRWDAIRDELFGNHFYLFALLGLFPGDWVVADLGCGTGTVAEALAPFVQRVIGVDASASMLDVARARLDRFENVELRPGELESLPLLEGQVDAVTMILVLHHLDDPQAAIVEAARCLRPGGRILIVDMVPHDRLDYQVERGHVWLGFSENQINEYLEVAGFGPGRLQMLPPAPEAKGPNLFAVSARVRRKDQ
jgi:ubiquinone/menaquinone biosynthesis C-methylase UbiE/DNA-binding transcriptional ArsR family regulator